MSDRAAESEAGIAAAGLIYVSDAMPGIRRIRQGDKFAYVLADGRRLTDEASRVLR